MARKNDKRNTNPLQATIFDIPGMEEEMPVFPAIADFAIRVRERQQSEPEEPIDEIESVAIDDADDDLLFLSFGSGSSGNSTYIGTRREGVLIDAGVDAATIIDGLRDNGLSMDCVKGICLTHDHSDHVRSVYALVRKNRHIGIYCTPKTLSGILRRTNISRRIKDYHRPIYKEFPFSVGGMELTAFDVSHDGTDNNGYYLTRRAHTFAIATDLGCITPRVDYYMRQARYVMLESNYDALMLANGPYPQYLKARIAAERGHLDNLVTATFLKEIYTPNLRYVFLCHLSKDNNKPELAIEASRSALLAAGAPNVGDCSGSITSREAPVQLMTLPRYGTSPLIVLRSTEE